MGGDNVALTFGSTFGEVNYAISTQSPVVTVPSLTTSSICVYTGNCLAK